MASEADPMLQGTYLHDDAKDFVPTSVALDLFDARLASGQPVHSAHSPKRKYEPSQGVPVAEQHYNCAQKQQPSGKIFKNFDPPTGNNISSLTDEERERLEEIEAVRHLGNDSDDDNE